MRFMVLLLILLASCNAQWTPGESPVQTDYDVLPEGTGDDQSSADLSVSITDILPPNPYILSHSGISGVEEYESTPKQSTLQSDKDSDQIYSTYCFNNSNTCRQAPQQQRNKVGSGSVYVSNMALNIRTAGYRNVAVFSWWAKFGRVTMNENTGFIDVEHNPDEDVIGYLSQPASQTMNTYEKSCTIDVESNGVPDRGFLNGAQAFMSDSQVPASSTVPSNRLRVTVKTSSTGQSDQQRNYTNDILNIGYDAVQMAGQNGIPQVLSGIELLEDADSATTTFFSGSYINAARVWSTVISASFAQSYFNISFFPESKDQFVDFGNTSFKSGSSEVINLIDQSKGFFSDTTHMNRPIHIDFTKGYNKAGTKAEYQLAKNTVLLGFCLKGYKVLVHRINEDEPAETFRIRPLYYDMKPQISNLAIRSY